jgi:NMD protein affecting ribosome stability and mRNA decay
MNVTCLKCGKKFDSVDPTRNRVCQKCNVKNERAPGILETKENHDGRVFKKELKTI